MKKEISINTTVKSDEEAKEFLKDIETLKSKYIVFASIQIIPPAQLFLDDK